MKKILLLGGAGFIGRALSNQYKSIEDYEVTILSQSSCIENNFKCLQLNYSKENFILHLEANSYDVIHFLSGNPYPLFSEKSPVVDIELTILPVLAMLEALRVVDFKGSFWVASSVAVYGECPDKFLNEESKCIPVSNYGVAKLTIEEYTKLYARLYGLKLGVYRIFSTFGPSLLRQFIYDNIMKIKENPKSIKLLSSTNTARDISFVDDQALAIKFLGDNVTPSGDIYNVGSGKAYKIVDVVNLIADLMSYGGDIIAGEDIRSFDGAHWVADVNKIEELGFKQKFTLKEGLVKTIENFI